MRWWSWKAHPHYFDCCRHCVGSIHTTTTTRARAGITFKIFNLFCGHITVVPFTDTFENRNQVDILTVKVTWCNGTTIGKNRWNIHVSNGNHRTRHVLITTTNSNKGIDVVTTHSCFDWVGNDITRCQWETHPWCPHGNTISNSNRTKLNWPSTRVFNTFFGNLTKTVQVDITWCVLSPSWDNPNNRLFKTIIRHPSRTKHGTVRWFNHAIVDRWTVFHVIFRHDIFLHS